MNRKQAMVCDLITQIQDLVPATRSLDLSFNLCTCRIYSNSRELLRKMQGHYQRFCQQVPAPDYLVTVLDTPPVLLDSAYDLCIDRVPPLRVDSELADDLDGVLSHDRARGMLSVTGHGRHVLLGPCLEHTDAVELYIYNLYQRWQLQACHPRTTTS